MDRRDEGDKEAGKRGRKPAVPAPVQEGEESVYLCDKMPVMRDVQLPPRQGEPREVTELDVKEDVRRVIVPHTEVREVIEEKEVPVTEHRKILQPQVEVLHRKIAIDKLQKKQRIIQVAQKHIVDHIYEKVIPIEKTEHVAKPKIIIQERRIPVQSEPEIVERMVKIPTAEYKRIVEAHLAEQELERERKEREQAEIDQARLAAEGIDGGHGRLSRLLGFGGRHGRRRRHSRRSSRTGTARGTGSGGRSSRHSSRLALPAGERASGLSPGGLSNLSGRDGIYRGVLGDGGEAPDSYDDESFESGSSDDGYDDKTPRIRYEPLPVETPMLQYRPVPIKRFVKRNVPIPVKLHVTQEYKCPLLVPTWKEVCVPVHVAREIEKPVPADTMHNKKLLQMYMEQTQDVDAMADARFKKTAAAFCGQGAKKLTGPTLHKMTDSEIKAAGLDIGLSQMKSMTGTQSFNLTTHNASRSVDFLQQGRSMRRDRRAESLIEEHQRKVEEYRQARASAKAGHP